MLQRDVSFGKATHAGGGRSNMQVTLKAPAAGLSMSFYAIINHGDVNVDSKVSATQVMIREDAMSWMGFDAIIARYTKA